MFWSFTLFIPHQRQIWCEESGFGQAFACFLRHVLIPRYLKVGTISQSANQLYLTEPPSSCNVWIPDLRHHHIPVGGVTHMDGILLSHPINNQCGMHRDWYDKRRCLVSIQKMKRKAKRRPIEIRLCKALDRSLRYLLSLVISGYRTCEMSSEKAFSDAPNSSSSSYEYADSNARLGSWRVRG